MKFFTVCMLPFFAVPTAVALLNNNESSEEDTLPPSQAFVRRRRIVQIMCFLRIFLPWALVRLLAACSILLWAISQFRSIL
jgi:hypothetical protein